MDSSQAPAPPSGSPRAWALIVALGLLFAPVFLGGAPFYRDLKWWVWPADWLIGRALREGRLPGWNPWQALGAPVLADPLHGVFYPPNLPAFFVRPTSWAVGIVAWLHVVLGALGTRALARRLGASPYGALVAGLTWGLAGFTHSEWSSGIRLQPAAWIPWAGVVAWDLVRACRRARSIPWRAVALAAVPTAASTLTGEFFITLFGVIFAIPFALLSAWSDPEPPADRRAAWRLFALALACAGALAFLLGLPALAPALGALAGTSRASALSRAAAEGWSMSPWRLLDTVMVGGLSLAWATTRHPRVTALLGVDWPLIQSFYLGPSALALALAGLRRDRRTAVLGFVALLGLGLAFGRFTPLYTVARAVIVPLRYMRSPEKLFVLVVPAFAVLAGLGLDRLFDAPSRLTRVASAVAGVMALGVFFAWSSLPPYLSPVMTAGAAHALVPLLGVLVVLRVARGRPTLAAGLVALIVALDLRNALRLLHRGGGGRDVVATAPPLALRLRAQYAAARAPAPVRLYRSERVTDLLTRAPDLPTEDRDRASLQPNLNVPYQLAVLPGYDVAISPRVEALINARRIDALRLLAVDAALMPLRVPPPPGLRLEGEFFPGVGLYTVEGSLPRVYAAAQALRVTNDADIASLLRPEVVSGEAVVLPTSASPTPANIPAGRAGPCALTRLAEGLMDARCTLDRPAWVTFVEQHDVGWSATIDGRPAALWQVNGVMMAVRAEAGAHVIKLRYEPRGLRLGLAAGALGLALAGLALTRRRA